MPEVPRRPLSAVTVREDGRARTAELPRPQWQGLFQEPDLPPLEEEDEG